MRSSILLPLLVTSFVALKEPAHGAPVEMADSSSVASATDKPDCKGDSEHADFYDQRQNGTENYRIHLNGVVVLVAPAETVLQAAQMASLESELDGIMSEASGLKPKPRPPSPSEKVAGEGVEVHHPGQVPYQSAHQGVHGTQKDSNNPVGQQVNQHAAHQAAYQAHKDNKESLKQEVDEPTHGLHR